MTFDVSERRWITATLDGQPGTVLALYSGTTAWYDLVADPEGELSWLVSTNPDGGPEKRLTDAGAELGLFRGERKIELRRLEDQRQ